MAERWKFKSLVHYVCSKRTDAPDTLGAVKLNKILWLSDLEYFYQTGQPLTNSRYVKREFGPVPARILPVLRELEQEGVLSVREANHFGRRKKEYRVHHRSDGSFLTDQERQIVDEVIDYVCDEHTASSVSLASHNHVWQIAEPGEELPLYTVFATPGKITNIERQWARTMLESEESAV